MEKVHEEYHREKNGIHKTSLWVMLARGSTRRLDRPGLSDALVRLKETENILSR